MYWVFITSIHIPDVGNLKEELLLLGMPEQKSVHMVVEKALRKAKKEAETCTPKTFTSVFFSSSSVPSPKVSRASENRTVSCGTSPQNTNLWDVIEYAAPTRIQIVRAQGTCEVSSDFLLPGIPLCNFLL